MTKQYRGRSRGWVAALLVIALGALAGCLSGCTTGRLSSANERLERQLIEQRLDPTQIELPWDLTPDMQAWVGKRVPRIGSAHTRLTLLLHYLLAPDQLGIQYEKGYTGTAAEVFESRKANCLSFSHLFVGMARQLGVPVYYLGVREIEGYEQEGDLLILSGHVTVGHGPRQERLILEFALGPEVDYHDVEPLSDLTALALHHSNRGAELMRAGRLEEAVASLSLATRLDPQLPAGWANLGVGLRRLDRWQEAETAYRRAIDADPRFTTAYQNLAALLRRDGRQEEAGELLAVMADIGPRNPYSYLALGDLSLARGQLDEARRFYKKALDRYGRHADTFAAMGTLELTAGDRVRAERWLSRAREIDPEAERVQSLESRLAATAHHAQPQI